MPTLQPRPTRLISGCVFLGFMGSSLKLTSGGGRDFCLLWWCQELEKGRGASRHRHAGPEEGSFHRRLVFRVEHGTRKGIQAAKLTIPSPNPWFRV